MHSWKEASLQVLKQELTLLEGLLASYQAMRARCGLGSTESQVRRGESAEKKRGVRRSSRVSKRPKRYGE